MNLKRYCLFLLLILATICNQSSAQQKTSSDTGKYRKAVWIALGFGYTSLGDAGQGLAGNFNVNAEIPNHWLITASTTDDLDRWINYHTEITTYNLLAGKIIKQKFSFFSVSAGLGLVNRNEHYYYDPPYRGIGPPPGDYHKYTIGIPVMIQGYLVGLQAAGIGVSLYANINTLQTTGGLTFNVALGPMYTHSKRNNR